MFTRATNSLGFGAILHVIVADFLKNFFFARLFPKDGFRAAESGYVLVA